MLFQDKNNSEVKLIPLTADTLSHIEYWLGLKGNGRLQSYLPYSNNDSKILDEIKEILFQEVVSQQGHDTAKKAIRKYMEENKEAAKLLEDCYYDLVYDLYSQIDRSISNQYAIRLDLNYAIYEGGLTTNSRNFCKEHNGNAYTRDEITAFNPETNLPNYNPIQDMGGIGCRHHLNWIPFTVASIFRPELKK